MNISYRKIINKILSKKYTIAVAESCTGGNICSQLTKFPGISKSFFLGIISYSNESKIKLLKINKKRLHKYGAVSKEIARDMAENLMKLSKCDFTISITGISGPTGETKNKPIGLVYIGIGTKNKIYVYKRIFKGTRIAIQKKSTKMSLELLYKRISL